MADGKITDEEALLIRHLVQVVRSKHQVVDEEVARLVDIDPQDVWRRLEAEPGDLSDILDVAGRVAPWTVPSTSTRRSFSPKYRIGAAEADSATTRVAEGRLTCSDDACCVAGGTLALAEALTAA
jgi:hypothetical protein